MVIVTERDPISVFPRLTGDGRTLLEIRIRGIEAVGDRYTLLTVEQARSLVSVVTDQAKRLKRAATLK